MKGEKSTIINETVKNGVGPTVETQINFLNVRTRTSFSGLKRGTDLEPSSQAEALIKVQWSTQVIEQ